MNKYIEEDSETLLSLMGRTDCDRITHNSKKQLFCDLCDWSGELHYNYHRHNFLHTDYSTYTCKLCNKQIKPEKFNVRSRNSLKTEKNRTKVVKPLPKKKPHNCPDIVCEECGFKTKRKDLFSKHKVEHIPEEERVVYKCDDCDYETFYQSSLRTHISSKHLQKKGRFELTDNMVLCCELCGCFTTESKELVQLHKQQECPFRHTDLRELQKGTMGTGVEQVMHVITDDETNEKLNKMLENTEGKKQTRGISELLNIKVPNPVHVGRLRKNDLVGKAMKQRVYMCDNCDFLCLRRWNMVRHKECLHKRKEVMCHLCGYTTKYLPWLYSHYKKTHNEDPPQDVKDWVEDYKKGRLKFIDKAKPRGNASQVNRIIKREVCHLCGKSLIGSLLKKHMRTVHSNLEEGCNIVCHHEGCSYSTMCSSYMARHIRRVHIGTSKEKNKRLYECSKCDSSFTVKRSFNKHVKDMHKEDMEQSEKQTTDEFDTSIPCNLGVQNTTIPQSARVDLPVCELTSGTSTTTHETAESLQQQGALVPQLYTAILPDSSGQFIDQGPQLLYIRPDLLSDYGEFVQHQHDLFNSNNNSSNNTLFVSSALLNNSNIDSCNVTFSNIPSVSASLHNDNSNNDDNNVILHN